MKQNRKKKGQVILEWTFCMIIVMLMAWGAIWVLHWTGTDLAERRRAHKNELFKGINPNYGSEPRDGPLSQIDPYFYSAKPMRAVFGER